MINDKMGAKELPMAGMILEDGNSESFGTGEWRNERPVHIEENCKHCMLCVMPCPDNAIRHTEDDKMIGFDYDKCKGCGICSKVCPFAAIKMIKEEN